MPGGDRTGPMGMGPMTGRAAGYCAGYPVPGYMNPAGGRGFGGWGRGGGRGGGRGWRNWYHATGLTGWQRAAMGWPAFGAGWGGAVPPPQPFAAGPTGQQEMDMLRSQAEYLQDVLENIRKRIDELDSQAPPEES